MAMVARKDHKSYAQVVVRKCDSNHMSYHKVRSDTAKQYSNSTQGFSACCNTRLGLNYNHGGSVFTKSAGKQVKVTSDPVAHKDFHVPRHSNQVSSKTIGQSLSKHVYEDNAVSTKNRFSILVNENVFRIQTTVNCIQIWVRVENIRHSAVY